MYMNIFELCSNHTAFLAQLVERDTSTLVERLNAMSRSPVRLCQEASALPFDFCSIVVHFLHVDNNGRD